MGGSPIIEQSFGESLIRALLQSGHAPKYAADTAARWRGDRLFYFQAGRNSVIAWFSTWESEKHAHEFLRAYQPVLEKRQRIRFRPAGDHSADVLTADARDRGAFLLEVKDNSVLVLNALPASHLAELQGGAWQDLEIDLVPAVVRFDSARLTVQ